MGQYTPTHHPELLAEHAVAYRQKDFIADLVIPSTGINSKLVNYYKFARADANRITDSQMAPDGMPNQRKFTKALATTEVEPFGLFDRIPVSDISSQSDGGDLEMDTVEDLADDLLAGREKRVADLVMTAANYGSANKITLTNAWTDLANSTPIQDIQTGLRACALPANIMVMDQVSWDAFRVHPDILDRLGGPTRGTGMVTQAQVAEIFDLEAVYIGKTKYNSANPTATASFDYIWPQGKVLLARQPKSPRRKELMLARTYRLNQASQGGADDDGRGGFNVYQEVEGERGSIGTLFVKVAMEEATVIVASDAGYHITNAA